MMKCKTCGKLIIPMHNAWFHLGSGSKHVAIPESEREAMTKEDDAMKKGYRDAN